MKNIKKIILLVIFLLSFMVCFSAEVNAYEDDIKKVVIDIKVNKNGTANIKEVWTTEVESGTENYKSMGNLGVSEVYDFTVTDETGRTYTYAEEWDIDASRDEKNYKNSIHKTPSGIELCWGLGKNGKRIYTLKYKISNFMDQYTDKQGIYFYLMPRDMDPAPKYVKVTIKSDTKFNKTNAQIWAFGYSGDIQFVDGSIVMEAPEGLRSSDYMVALVSIEGQSFQTKSIIPKTFDEIYQEAMEDADKNKDIRSLKDLDLDEEDFGALRKEGIKFVLFLVPIIIILIIFKRLDWLFKKHITKSTSKFKQDTLGGTYFQGGTDLPRMKNVNYWRELPCDKDLLKVYWIAEHYNIITDKAGLIGAILLKWIRLGYIQVSKKDKLISFLGTSYSIDFNQMYNADNAVEQQLLSMLKTASRNNGILESKELKRWCKKNYRSIHGWFSYVIRYETEQLEKEGLISRRENTNSVFGIINFTSVSREVSLQLKEEAIKLLGLKKFLLDFSRIAQREPIEVHMWEEYLIFAQLLGIADKVEKQFNKLYPAYSEMSNIDTKYTTVATRSMAIAGCYAAEKAYKNYTRRAESGDSSSGEGGASESSGGSSARGGSSGGGRR